MTKIGRNDPCPCGSGKKYKKCCAEISSTSAPKKALTEAKTKAELLAKKWMGSLSADTVESADKPLQLFLDVFKVRDPRALEAVKSLGKVKDDIVHFYQGKQWVGEADLSIEGQLVLTTAQKEIADVLCKKLKSIPGLVHKSRKEDRFEGLDEQARLEATEGMLDFKIRFFKTWADEPNDRLAGSTPRQAAEDRALKPKLLGLITELEKRESKLPKKERYSFKAIRRDLGLLS